MPQETIPKEKIEELNAYFEQQTKDGKSFTLAEVAAATGVSTPTVAKYKKMWERRKNEAEALKNQAIQPDPLEVFDAALRNIPGVAESKVDFVVNAVRANPKYLERPQEIYQMLIEAVSLKPYFANLIMKSVFPDKDFATLSTQFGSPYGPPAPPGYAQAPGTQYAPPYAQAPPYAPFPWPGYPYAPPPPGYPPPYWTPAPQPQQQPTGITKEDLRAILAEFGSRNEATPSNMEEIEEPVVLNGQPVLDGDGHIVYRTIRRPQTAPQAPPPPIPPPQKDPLDALIKLKEAGIIPDANKAPPPAPAVDAQTTALLASLRDGQADLRAQLAAEKVRREEADKYTLIVEEKDEQLRAAEREAAKAAAGLPADAVIIMKALDKTDKVMDNVDKRLGRIESLAMTVLAPERQVARVDRTEAELETILARQMRVDAMEAQPPTEPPSSPTEKGTNFVPHERIVTAPVATPQQPNSETKEPTQSPSPQ